MMRALRVVGLDESGSFVVCEDTVRRERFKLPADERLRAAARADLTRLGQIELESQMRPREIQSRIRAGESIDQVAQGSGMPAERVERFAYPVLLERSRKADLAQRAHPVREDGPDVRTLGEVVAHAFGLRGQDYATVNWDAWRGEDGRWVIAMRWRAGRSENRAHWVFAPGAHGGTVTTLDEQAAELMDPDPNRPLRTVPAPNGAAPTREPEILGQDPQDSERVPVSEAETPVELLTTNAAGPVDGESSGKPPEVGEDAAATEPGKRGKKSHPIVPSWEDVLLGVRSSRG